VLGYLNYYLRYGFITAGIVGLETPYPIAKENTAAGWGTLANINFLIGLFFLGNRY